MWAYDLEADTWTEKGLAPVDDASAPVLRPGLGPRRRPGGRRRRGHARPGLWSYDVETDTWTPIHQAKPLAIGPQDE